ncbi:hypothetical protein M427DRAFT_420838 [Gonapodya prolifera JEL478]|uniref:LIM zinc-binding domain-containing protein n=1 Tax=Gonapodya prolifera (strain JEL478) TaxID=1344416 RepID=A0A139A4F7_GONPJ|nr:hypothetical protein M427DRAFT_420838 [Gonapodya prolifera JEL478]|eukprot:KXS11681.1 hypothetical protein M427DRAFT_420838 [Gonapodya prolifera JEL478]
MKSSTASLSTDKLYCRTHTPTPHAPPTCGAKCGQPLGGPVIDALGQTFHQPCFTCADCSVQLRGRFFPARGRAYCQTCYRLSGAIVCQQCRGPIETEYFHINGAYFHTKCKTCDRCASTLFAGQYFTLEGVGLFCNSHRADMLVCRGCGLPVGGTSEGAGVLDRMVVSGQGRVYHVEHFTCASCGRNALGGEYVEGAAGVVVCRACKC